MLVVLACRWSDIISQGEIDICLVLLLYCRWSDIISQGEIDICLVRLLYCRWSDIISQDEIDICLVPLLYCRWSDIISQGEIEICRVLYYCTALYRFVNAWQPLHWRFAHACQGQCSRQVTDAARWIDFRFALWYWRQVGRFRRHWSGKREEGKREEGKREERVSDYREERVKAITEKRARDKRVRKERYVCVCVRDEIESLLQTLFHPCLFCVLWWFRGRRQRSFCGGFSGYELSCFFHSG